MVEPLAPRDPRRIRRYEIVARWFSPAGSALAEKWTHPRTDLVEGSPVVADV